MSISANLVYLDDERQNIIRRISQIKQYLKENPRISIYQRKINGNKYYYKKFRQEKYSISQYLGNSKSISQDIFQKIKQHNQKIDEAKKQLLLAKLELKAIEKQLKIVRQAFEHERTTGTTKNIRRILPARHL